MPSNLSGNTVFNAAVSKNVALFKVFCFVFHQILGICDKHTDIVLSSGLRRALLWMAAAVTATAHSCRAVLEKAPNRWDWGGFCCCCCYFTRERWWSKELVDRESFLSGSGEALTNGRASRSRHETPVFWQCGKGASGGVGFLLEPSGFFRCFDRCSHELPKSQNCAWRLSSSSSFFFLSFKEKLLIRLFKRQL